MQYICTAFASSDVNYLKKKKNLRRNTVTSHLQADSCSYIFTTHCITKELGQS